MSVSLPKDLEVYVDLNDTTAALSVGDVSLTIGTADVTDEYTLSYNWYYQTALVGTRRLLPAPRHGHRQGGGL